MVAVASERLVGDRWKRKYRDQQRLHLSLNEPNGRCYEAEL